MKLRHKKWIAGAVVCLVAAVSALSFRPMTSHASDWVVTWSDQGEGEPGSVKLSVQLPPEEKVDQAATFRLSFRLETESGETLDEDAVAFAFARKLRRSSEDIVIQDYRYEDGMLEILVAGRKDADGTGGVLNKDTAFVLGTMTVTCQEDVTVTLESGQVVDESGELAELSELGGSYIIEGSSPAPTEPEEPTDPAEPEEPTDPAKPEGPTDPETPGETEAPDETEGATEESRWYDDSDSDDGWNPAYAVPGQTAVETKGSWSQAADGSWRFRRENGSLVKDEWICAGGNWYRIGGDGVMLTGWFEYLGQSYYLKDSGAMQTGWLELQGEWYLFGADGAVQTGWIQSGENWYYLNPVRPTVTLEKDPVTGELKETIGDQMPYGRMYRNTVTPDGYPVDGNGAWIR